jgi:hypothetical protein
MPTPEEQLRNVQQIQQALEDGFRSLTASIQNVAEEIGEATDNLITFNTISKDITRTIKSISRTNEDLINNQIKLNKGQLESKKIEQQIEQLQTKKLISQSRLNSLQNELNDALATGRITAADAAIKQATIANLTAEIAQSAQETIGLFKSQLEEAEKIEGVMGNLGSIVKGLNKIPIIGQFMQTEKIMSAMQETAKNTGSKTQVMLSGFKAIGSSIKEGILDPLTLVTFILNESLKANRQTVELGKALGKNSFEYRENLVGIERASNNINVTTANLVGAFSELATATGFAYEFSADQLETQIKLTKQVGLTAEEAAQIQRFGVLNNKTSEETYKSFVKGLVATRNQLKVGIDFKATLAETVKVSGQLAAQLGYNPERIAKAIVTAKAFGMTLEQVAKSGESLLNFETSIENELKAELLTGKQLNLERARAAALSGDQATVAAEIAANVGTAADFAKMNTLEQKALAEAVGMTADELSNTLIKREEALKSGKSLAQVDAEQVAEALERQSIQDKFNAAVEKLQSLFGNLLAGPLGSFLDMLSGALNIVNKLGNALSFLATPLKIIASLYAGIVAYNKTIDLFNNLSLIKTNALFVLKGQQMGQEVFLNRQKQIGEAMEKRSLLQRIAYNAYLGGSLLLQKAGNLLSKKGLLSNIGSAVMSAATSVFKSPVGLLGPLAIPIAIAAGAGVGALGYKFLTGDDIMSEGGYGKRTLLSPEGAIRLNDKDTVIAGTDLGGGEGSGISPSIDLTPMIVAINEVKAEISRLANRPIEINLDGKKVGSGLTQGSYKVA